MTMTNSRYEPVKRKRLNTAKRTEEHDRVKHTMTHEGR